MEDCSYALPCTPVWLHMLWNRGVDFSQPSDLDVPVAEGELPELGDPKGEAFLIAAVLVTQFVCWLLKCSAANHHGKIWTAKVVSPPARDIKLDVTFQLFKMRALRLVFHGLSYISSLHVKPISIREVSGSSITWKWSFTACPSSSLPYSKAVNLFLSSVFNVTFKKKKIPPFFYWRNFILALNLSLFLFRSHLSIT